MATRPKRGLAFSGHDAEFVKVRGSQEIEQLGSCEAKEGGAFVAFIEDTLQAAGECRVDERA